MLYYLGMVVSEVLKFDRINNFDNLYIEKQFTKLGISPVRWAIVDIDDLYIFVSVSYEK